MPTTSELAPPSTPVGRFLSTRKPSPHKSPRPTTPCVTRSPITQFSTYPSETPDVENPLLKTPTNMFHGLRSQRTKLKTIKDGYRDHLVMPSVYEQQKEVNDGVEMEEVRPDVFGNQLTGRHLIMSNEGFISSRRPPQKVLMFYTRLPYMVFK